MPYKEIGEIFTENLKRLLEQNNMTNKEFADKIGVKASSVSMWMSGKSLPRMGTLDKIADLFNVPVEFLVTDKTDDPIQTLAAHLDGNDFTEHQWQQIQRFAKYIKSLSDNEFRIDLANSTTKYRRDFRRFEGAEISTP